MYRALNGSLKEVFFLDSFRQLFEDFGYWPLYTRGWLLNKCIILESIVVIMLWHVWCTLMIPYIPSHPVWYSFAVIFHLDSPQPQFPSCTTNNILFLSFISICHLHCWNLPEMGTWWMILQTFDIHFIKGSVYWNPFKNNYWVTSRFGPNLRKKTYWII